jgi:hypothetical protein
MKRYVNKCCDCATPNYPCRGNLCPLRRVLEVSCSSCGATDTELYVYNGEEYCVAHLIEALISDGIVEECG